MEKANQLRIAIIGPESTGKSEIAKELAHYFGIDFIAEYARNYLSGKEAYTFDDVTTIAQEQFRQIEEYKLPILIADTELIVTKIWQQYKYGKVSGWIEKHIKKQNFDIYLLMDIDLEWTFDALRENPSQSEREELLALYKSELDHQGFNYQLISGDYSQRTKNALEAIKKTTKE
tara:strand:- start:82 stop:606 length:525 start_codon:yes stop_codon:yes gene_type:complete